MIDENQLAKGTRKQARPNESKPIPWWAAFLGVFACLTPLIWAMEAIPREAEDNLKLVRYPLLLMIPALVVWIVACRRFVRMPEKPFPDLAIVPEHKRFPPWAIKFFIHLMTVGAFFGMFYAAAMLANWKLADGPAVTRRVRVVERLTSDIDTGYSLRVQAPDHNGGRVMGIMVSKEVFDRAAPNGSDVELTIRPGALGAPWIESMKLIEASARAQGAS